MRYIGYARVSTADQNLDLQKDALSEAGCQIIFDDKVSGAKQARPGFDSMMEYLKEGDCLVVWRLARLGRSLIHLVSVVDQLRERGIQFKSLSDGIVDTTSPTGELVFGMFALLSQFERRLIQERTNAGLSAARARGREGGRPGLKATDPKVRMAKDLYASKSLTVKEICEQLGVKKAQFYKYLKVGEQTHG